MERCTRARAAPRRRPVGRLVRLGAGRLPGAARRQHHALCAVAGAGLRPERGHCAGRHQLAHDGGAGQCRRLAFRRAGRRAQRLGVPPRGRGVSARAGRRAKHRRQRRRTHGGLRRGLRGRHPRGRVPGPQPVQDLPHHGHGRHAGGGRRRGPPLEADAGADAARLRLGRHTVGGAVGVFAQRRRQQAAAHRARSGCGADGGLSGARRRDWRARHLHRRARHGRRHVQRCRPGQTDRRPRHALGHGRNFLQMACLVPPHPPRRRRPAAGDARARPQAKRHCSGHLPCAPGRHRRAGPRGIAQHRAPEQVLDGHRSGPGRALWRCGFDGVRRRLPGAGHSGPARESAHGARPRGGRRLPAALDWQGHGHDRRWARAARPRR